MEKLYAVHLVDLKDNGQTGFDFFEYEEDADKQLEKINSDIKKYNKESEFKAVKRLVDYDSKRNAVNI
jgi:hypothetical protein